MKTICLLCVFLFIGIAKIQIQKAPSASTLSFLQKDSSLNLSVHKVIKTDELSYRIINSASHTYCYNIYSKNLLLIQQPSMPGLPGHVGFKTKADAIKEAQLVIIKLKRGIMPPTVTIAEMKLLKLIK